MNLKLPIICLINPVQPKSAFHVETSHLICRANQMTGFYMKRNIGVKWVNENITKNERFHFLLTKQENNLKKIFRNIPTRRYNGISGICSLVLENIWNDEILLNKNFPENLKLVDEAEPTFKKNDKTFVQNCRLVKFSTYNF